MSLWIRFLNYVLYKDDWSTTVELIGPNEYVTKLEDTMSNGKKLFDKLNIQKQASYYGDTCYVADVIKALDAAVSVQGTETTFFSSPTDGPITHTGFVIGVETKKDKKPEDFLLALVKLNKENQHFLTPDVQDMLDEVEEYVKIKGIK